MSFLTCPPYTSSVLNTSPTGPTSNYCYSTSSGLIVTRLDTAWSTWWATSEPSKTNGSWQVVEVLTLSSSSISSSSQALSSSQGVSNPTLTDQGLNFFTGLIFFLFGFYLVHIIFKQIRRYI